MAKNFLAKCLLIAFMLPIVRTQAKDNTPIETFINSVKRTNSFIPVSNIWQADNSFDQKELLKMVEKAQPLSIDYAALAQFVKQKTTAISLVLPGIGGGSYTVDLARYEFLTNDFEVHAMGADGDKLASYTPGVYYRGVVNGIPGSVAAFSFFNNEVYGIFSIPGEGNYVVAPNTMTGNEYNYNPHYILYNDADLKITNMAPGCATDKLPDLDLRRAAKTTTTANNKLYNNCTMVRCFETADFAMYVKKGSTVANSTNYITALFNNKSTIYRNEGIIIALKYIQVNTATDAYQSLALNSSTWLNKFGDVTMNTMHSCDIATLFTTHSGNMGGVAWLGTMCLPYQSSSHAGPYAFCNIDNVSSLTPTAFPTFSWDVEVSSHEMGHVVGSPHTHRCCWNPPSRTTAIDGCYTIEGSCPDPGNPSSSVKGTIMSYCHLVSGVGINLANGFGPQPGDTIRFFLAGTFGIDCGSEYTPATALTKPNRTISANRECTDMNGVTYYWKDNNTADQADDTLVLMMKKGTVNIGNLNTTGFSVSTSTVASYGGGTGVSFTFPSGVPTITTSYAHFAMRRFWQFSTPTEPSAAVELMFPFLASDTADVSGSIAAPTPMSNFKMYRADAPIDPNPVNNFPTGIASNFTIYNFGTTPSTSTWSVSSTGPLFIAHMKTTKLSGGGTGFYQYSPTSVVDINGNGPISVYPNPTSNEWYVSAGPDNSETLEFQLYTADGRLVHSQVLQSGITNTVNGSDLATGIYFYRITGGNNVYTGNLQKN